MPAEPVSERNVDELVTLFNLWMFAARPHISDVEYRRSHWRPERIPDGTVDGRLRRYGDHNYMLEVFVPRGTADQLEIVHIAHEVKNLCAKA